MSDINKDAIKLLQEIKSIYFDKQSDNLDESNLIEIAVEALEKQIPKELSTVIKEANGREFKFYYCSSCYVNIESKYKYCLNCGQKLDWSDLSERD